MGVVKNHSFFYVDIHLTQHYLLVRLSFLHCSAVPNQSVGMDMRVYVWTACSTGLVPYPYTAMCLLVGRLKGWPLTSETTNADYEEPRIHCIGYGEFAMQ